MSVHWISRKKYKYDGRVGKIRTDDGLNFYMGFFPISNSYGKSVRELEQNPMKIPAGRPTVIAGEESILVGISLPQRLWDKLEKPYSLSIAKLIEGIE